MISMPGLSVKLTENECEIDREEVDQFGAGLDHVAGIAGLTELAMDSCLDIKRLRVADFVGGDDPGSDRRTGVESLPAAKLIPGETTGPPHLPIAGGYVVDNGISEHVVKRVSDRDVPARLADDHRQFRLAIKLLRQPFIVADIFTRADHAVRGFEKKLRLVAARR